MKQRGQLMLITVLVMGSSILGATAIAGLLTTYRIRQSTDAKDSAMAIFAADAGLEKAFFRCLKQSDCSNFGPETLSNGARYTVTISVNASGTPQDIRSTGVAGRVTRALRFRLF